MAVLLSCQNLSKSFSSRPLFEGLSFGLNDGECTGMIGPNGSGKSTLLRILAGIEKQDTGLINKKSDLRLAYLPQTEDFSTLPAGTTARTALSSLLEGMHLGEHEISTKVEITLHQAGFGDAEKDVSKLSGGWKKRLAILSRIITEPELLLLDEPTNHMDLEGVLWLEELLSRPAFSYLMVTHDRRFLERASNRVIEINKKYPDGFFSCSGNYSMFLEKREEVFSSQAGKQVSLQNTVLNEIAWLRRGPKARTTKAQARIDRAEGFIEELDELKYRNNQGRAVNIDFSGSQRSTRRLVELVEVSKSLGGRKLFGPVDVMLGPGEKLGLLGENGSGKSTLLKIINGQLEPDSGQRKQAEKLQIVYFDQHREKLDLNLTLREALCPSGDKVIYKGNPIHVTGWAKRFLFNADQLDRPLVKFSGGEQARVMIAQLMLKPADILLLDEPTNDLDISSLEVLEQSLIEFPGALVLVTHDRYLLDRVSKQILALDGQGNSFFFADYEQWETWNTAQNQDAEKDFAEKKSARIDQKRRERLITTKELREWEGMETRIHAAEVVVSELKAALEDPVIATQAHTLMERQKELEQAEQKVEELFKRWDELGEKKKKAEKESS